MRSETFPEQTYSAYLLQLINAIVGIMRSTKNATHASIISSTSNIGQNESVFPTPHITHHVSLSLFIIIADLGNYQFVATSTVL